MQTSVQLRRFILSTTVKITCKRACVKRLMKVEETQVVSAPGTE